MSLAFQDTNGLSIQALRIDEAQPTYRKFRIKNTSASPIENVKLRLLELGRAAIDASELSQRAVPELSYTRQSSGLAEKQYLGIGPIAVTTEDPEELEAVLMTGWLQLSPDSFRWGSLLQIGTLGAGEYLDVYARYQKPVYASTLTFQFSLHNIGTDTFLNAVLTASGSDLLSLNGVDFSSSVILGNLAPGIVKTIWIRTASVGFIVVNAKIEALTGSSIVSSIKFDVAGGRAYCSIHQVRSFLTTVNIDVVSSDEEILDLIYDAAEHIDRATQRRFDMTLTTERYDDPGVGKLVLRNWPIVEVNAIRLYDHSNKMMKELKPTDTDWSERVIVDDENGFLELPITRQPIFLATDIIGWRTGAPSERAEWPRSADVRRMASIVAWIEVDYVYGFQAIPELAQKACMKLVAMELLGKKGASESQGTSTFTIAGMGETWGQGAGVFGGPFGALLGQLNADVEKNLTLLQRRRGVAVSII